MSKRNEKYFNFPIQLLESFMIKPKKCLNDVLDYAIYNHYEKYLIFKDDEKEAIKDSASYFNVSLGEEKRTLENGELLYNSIPKNSPMVGIDAVIFWDYFKNDKTDFEKITLLGYLAIKSILQKKSYCKITNKFWLSRMDGKASSVKEYYELSEKIRKYVVHYQVRKIKSELERNWKLKTVHGRGFNVSFKMSLEALSYEVFKRRKKYQDEVLKAKKDEAKRLALERLYGTQP
jgi:hypothetical protein